MNSSNIIGRGCMMMGRTPRVSTPLDPRAPGNGCVHITTHNNTRKLRLFDTSRVNYSEGGRTSDLPSRAKLSLSLIINSLIIIQLKLHAAQY